jgi:hypothetical protein
MSPISQTLKNGPPTTGMLATRLHEISNVELKVLAQGA